ncbi:MAG: hypothetical protein JEY79_01045 [Pseudodesulfovibrio sp.]|nr:hypothetical protein [Pseudodesulfovibrio sp.]
MAWTFKTFNNKKKRGKRAYKNVFMNPDGQLVLADLAERNCVTRPIFGAGITTEQMLVNEGRRQVVLEILNALNLDPDALPKEYDNG